MARLYSDDPDVPSYIDWQWLPTVKVGDESWRGYSLTLRSGQYELNLTPMEGDIGACALAAKDLDELWQGLERGRRGEEWRFEPSEPNFTLELRPEPFGLSLHCWVDAGNQTSDHHSWDGIGVRFFTTVAALEEFSRDLSNDLELVSRTSHSHA